jgi:hypothetical protein
MPGVNFLGSVCDAGKHLVAGAVQTGNDAHRRIYTRKPKNLLRAIGRHELPGNLSESDVELIWATSCS